MTISSTLGPVRSTRRRDPDAPGMTSSYSGLLRRVRDAGLLQRRPAFYFVIFAVLALALLACVTGFILLGDSWFQLFIAAALGIVFTQLAFLAHELSHRQVFRSGPANDRAARILGNAIVGISYSWWMTKHTRHHANPNTVGKDPDIEMDTISFREENAASRTGFQALITRKQGYLFFPLLLLEGINLHVTSFKSILKPGHTKGRSLELTLLTLRMGLYLTPIFLVLPLGMAFAFIGVQLAVFGLYMGASFAPNHKGMPMIPAGTSIDFLSRQVLTSRNIRGAFGMSILLGGLNYQIEHHLFPNMPRPHLARAREIVREHCKALGIAYTETTLLHSYGIVIAYLNRVGLAARNPFECPLANQYRRR
jgi:fatty acid desaturase